MNINIIGSINLGDNEIQIDDHKAKMLVIEYLRNKFDIPEHGYIKDDNLWSWYDSGGGSHSWTEEEIHRKSKKIDESVLKVLDKLT